MIRFINLKLIKYIFIFIFSLIHLNYASSETSDIHCFKKFKLSLYDFGLFYIAAKKEGISKDLAKELEKRSKCTIEHVDDMTQIRALKSIENGTIDFKMSSIQTPEREVYSYFYHYSKSKNFVLIRKSAKAKSWEEFIANKNLKFGVVRGFRHGISDEKIIFLKHQNRVLEYVDSYKLYDALKEDDIQAILGLIPVYKFHLMHEKNLEPLIKVYDWNPQEKAVKNGLMISKKTFSKAEAEKWGALLNNMIADGTLFKIFRKYLNEKEAHDISLTE